MSKKSGNEIEDAETELEAAKGRYLRSHGWQYTSSTPGCLWMWVKRCDLHIGKSDEVRSSPRPDESGVPTAPCLIMVSTDTAISMQRHSCAIRGNSW